MHVSSDNTSRASIGTSYDLAKTHSHDLLSNTPAFQRNATWRGYLESITVLTSSWAGGTPPTSITLAVTADAAGDIVLVPSTTATLEAALTTASSGGAAFKVATPLTIVAGSAGDGTLYIHVKTDSGTLTLDNTTVIWSE